MMAIPTNLQASIGKRMEQLQLFIRELRSLSSQLVTEIDSGSIRATRLIIVQNALAQVKSNLQNWPLGSLTNTAIRARMAIEYPSTYVNAAAVQVDIAAANTALGSLAAEIESLLVTARSSGQLYDADPTTGLEVFMLLSTPDTDSLRTRAAAVRNSIAA